MVAWMDDEALHRTLTTGRATYWSRSRRELLGQGRHLRPRPARARGAAGLRRRRAAGDRRPDGRGVPHRRPDVLRRRRAARCGRRGVGATSGGGRLRRHGWCVERFDPGRLSPWRSSGALGEVALQRRGDRATTVSCRRTRAARAGRRNGPSRARRPGCAHKAAPQFGPVGRHGSHDPVRRVHRVMSSRSSIGRGLVARDAAHERGERAAAGAVPDGDERRDDARAQLLGVVGSDLGDDLSGSNGTSTAAVNSASLPPNQWLTIAASTPARRRSPARWRRRSRARRTRRARPRGGRPGCPPRRDGGPAGGGGEYVEGATLPHSLAPRPSLRRASRPLDGAGSAAA